MLLKLSLSNFRNYEKGMFEWKDKNIIVGENGAGKSNILEAICVLGLGKSFRADKEVEMKRLDGGDFFRIEGGLDNGDSLVVTMDGGYKKYSVNGVGRRMMDFVGKMKVVLFCPTDIDLVIGSPSQRRKYLDFVLMQKSKEYRSNIFEYEKALRQRNKLLDMIREGRVREDQLGLWDSILIDSAKVITRLRGEYLAGFVSDQRRLVYKSSEMSEERLDLYAREEILAGSTLVGPHRDDFEFEFEGRDASIFASRGQQRMLVFDLKLWEIQYLKDERLPVLVLDDIYSELDHQHKNRIDEMVELHVKGGGQVFVATADEHLVSDDLSWNITKL